MLAAVKGQKIFKRFVTVEWPDNGLAIMGVREDYDLSQGKMDSKASFDMSIFVALE